MTNIPISKNAICPTFNTCAVTEQSASACGSAFNHLNPLVPAEALCHKALTAKIAQFNPPDVTQLRGQADFSALMAWYQTERALNPKMDPTWSDEYCADVLLYARRVQENAFSAFSFLHKANLLELFMPAFKARRPDGEPLTKLDWLKLKHARARLSKTVTEAEIHPKGAHTGYDSVHNPCFENEEKKNDLIAREAVSLLAMEAGLRVYPTSPREERISKHKELRRVAHNGYHLFNDGTKLPIEARYDKEGALNNRYRPTVLYIGFASLIKAAHRSTVRQAPIQGFEVSNTPPSPSEALSWVGSYVLHLDQPTAQQRFARHMGRQVEQKIAGKLEKFRRSEELD